MHFDADMTSLGGQREVGGDAGAFNAELGWNVWTSAGGMKLVPQVQYTRTKVENIDRIEGDLADFVSDGGTSSRARLGLEMEQTFQSASGTQWTPYGVVSIVREFDGEAGFTVANTFSGRTSTEGTSGQLEFGVNAKIGQRVDVWGGLNYLDGGAIDGVWGGQLGIRYTW
jgi:outer membrane autotransporter protein